MQQGNFFSEWGDAEGRSNFALWCLMKAPLILGTDLTNMTAATLATITNKAAISVNKDPLAEQGVLRTSQWLPASKKTDPENNLPYGHMVVSYDQIVDPSRSTHRTLFIRSSLMLFSETNMS